MSLGPTLLKYLSVASSYNGSRRQLAYFKRNILCIFTFFDSTSNFRSMLCQVPPVVAPHLECYMLNIGTPIIIIFARIMPRHCYIWNYCIMSEVHTRPSKFRNQFANLISYESVIIVQMEHPVYYFIVER